MDLVGATSEDKKINWDGLTATVKVDGNIMSRMEIIIMKVTMKIMMAIILKTITKMTT